MWLTEERVWFTLVPPKTILQPSRKKTDSGILRGRLGFAGPNPLVLESQALSSVLFQAIKSLTPLLYPSVKDASDKCGTPGLFLHSNYLLP